VENKTKARCQVGNKAMKTKPTNMLRAPTKENALVLTAVDIGGKNTEE